MMIHSLDGKSRMGLELVESARDTQSRIAVLAVEVIGVKVRGVIERVWVEESAARSFIQRLHRLVLAREGSAILVSKTQGELELSLSITKGGPNALLGIRCRWPKRLEGGSLIVEEVGTGYEIAESSVDDFVSEMEKIFVPILSK